MSLKTNRYQSIAAQQCVAIFLCKYFVKSKKFIVFKENGITTMI